MTIRFGLLSCGVLFAACCLLATGFAKTEQWTDSEGNKFKAEPAEVVGPFALFRMPDRTGKLLPLGRLAPAEYVRFAEQVRGLPAPVADWAKAVSKIGAEIAGHAMRVQGNRLVDADLKGKPEPRFYVLFFVNNAESKSWEMLGKAGWQLPELQRKHPGLVEGIMFGVKHSAAEHQMMAVSSKVSFLVAHFADEYRMDTIRLLGPSAGYGVVIVNANGVPLFFSKADTDESAKGLFAQFSGLLDLLRLDNPQGLADRMNFWRAAQPALHAADKGEPLLVGDPLNAAVLRDRGVGHFEATLYVSAEGAVTGVSLAAGAVCPDDLLAPITEALHKALFVPAVDHGKFVAGSFRYRFGD